MPWASWKEEYDLSNLCSVLTWSVYIVFIKPAEKSSLREETTDYFRVEWGCMAFQELCLHQIDEIMESQWFLFASGTLKLW